MNALIVGTNKEIIKEYLPETFLIIDDGDFIDQLDIPNRKKITTFEVSKHTFNPLRGMDHRQARDFATTIYAAFPQGENTLTVRNGRRELAKLVLDAPRLDKVGGNRKDPAVAEALAAVDDVLFSPIVHQVLCNPANFSFKGTILARLNRAELGDFDCYILGNLLISQYRGPIVIPDFGFYAHPGHSALFRQNRIVAGVNSLDDVPGFKNQLLVVDTKVGSHCTSDDAKELALYAGLVRDTVEFGTFVANCISKTVPEIAKKAAEKRWGRAE